MASIRHSADSDVVTVEGKKLWVANVARGSQYAMSATTGTIAAALAANSSIFAARFNPSSSLKAYITRLRVQYTTIVAYTVPVTSGRRLELYRGSGAAASAGTAANPANAQKSTAFADSQFTTAQGGDVRISATAALTVTGITFETSPFRSVSLSHVGAAGGFIERLWEFSDSENGPMILQPGQLVAIRNPVAMDAAGTWVANIDIDWYEI